MDNNQFTAWLTRIEDKVDTLTTHMDNKIDKMSERITKLESNEKVFRLLFGGTGVIVGFIAREVLTRTI